MPFVLPFKYPRRMFVKHFHGYIRDPKFALIRKRPPKALSGLRFLPDGVNPNGYARWLWR